LPPEVARRQKQGFLLPIGGWLRTALRAEVESELRNPPEALAGVLRPEAPAGVWDAHLREGGTWLRPWALYALCRWADTVAAPAGERELVEAR
jgi:hypothetical protein